MAFPTENEEQIRRRVLDICQDHIRKVLGCTQELTLMIDDYATKSDSKSTELHLLEIRRLKDEATELKRGLMTELAESGMLLISREDLLRLVVEINQIADFSEGVAFRVNQVAARGWKVDPELKEALLGLAKNVLRTVKNLRETILALSYSRGRAIEMAKNVEVAEYAVDEIYREVEMKIIDVKMSTPVLLLLRDIAESLENIADKSEDAADAVRILALSI